MRILALLATLFLSTGALAQQPVITQVPQQQWQLGTHYFAIEPAQPTTTGDKVEIVEVFSYACPACARFQASADKLAKDLPAGSAFIYLPAELQPSWEPFARAFFAAEALGVREKTHQPLLNALHVEGKQMRTIEDIADYYATHGVDREQFLAVAKSFAVETKLKRARTIVPRYGIGGTPTMIVAGKYRIDGNAAGSYDNMVAIARWLAEREAAAKVAAAKP